MVVGVGTVKNNILFMSRHQETANRRIGRKRCHGKDRMPRKEFPMKGKSILGKTAGVIGSGPGGR